MIRNANIAREQLDARFTKMRAADLFARPARGWIRAIRDSLGMTAAQLAARLGVSQPRVIALEQGEVKGRPTLQTLEKVAAALDCTLVYALVPNRSLEAMVRDQAAKIAAERLASVDHTMRLEDQGVKAVDAKRQRERLIDDILRTEGRRLWDRP
jgi:predicted DNA-binding mobile mystery protein A